MTNYFLIYNIKEKGWILKKSTSQNPIEWSENKKVAISSAIKFCHENASGIHPISLKIKKKDGKIQEERTFPRSADPKKTKG